MLRLRKFILFLCTLLLVSCFHNKSKDENVNQIKQEDYAIYKEEDYTIHTTRVEFYEIGYNSENEVYLTDKRTNEQIVFICEGSAYGDYSKQDLLNCYKKNITVPYSEASDNLYQTKMDIFKNASFGNDVVYSEHFKSDMTRYYVNYKDVYSRFHM